MKNKKIDLVRVYLDEIGRFPLLTREEETDLAKKKDSDDQEAAKKLANSNLRLVVSIAKKYRNALNFTFLGLVQYGNYGLLAAVKGFDWKEGNKFSTYAKPCIERAIEAAVYGNGIIASLDAPVSGDDSGESLHGFVEDKKSALPSAGAERISLSGIIREALSELDFVAQKAMIVSFGLEDGIRHKPKEVAEILGIPTEKVRRIVEISLKTLKRHKKLKKLDNSSQ